MIKSGIPDDRDVISDDLYREIILDHYRSPRHRGRLDDATFRAEGKNPLCGDEISLDLRVSNQRGVIDGVGISGKGCAISQASGSMMAEALTGRTLEESAGYARAFKRVMLEGAEADLLPPELEDLKSLENVKQYPVRIKCAILAWNTLLEAIKENTSHA